MALKNCEDSEHGRDLQQFSCGNGAYSATRSRRPYFYRSFFVREHVDVIVAVVVAQVPTPPTGTPMFDSCMKQSLLTRYHVASGGLRHDTWNVSFSITYAASAAALPSCISNTRLHNHDNGVNDHDDRDRLDASDLSQCERKQHEP